MSNSVQRRTPRLRARGLLLLLFVVGVAVPTFLYWLPSERARWQIAAARAKWLDGDLAGAIQVLDAASQEFPDTSAIYEQRIEFNLEAEEFDKALADAERLLKLLPKSQTPYWLKMQTLQHLGRHSEAIEVCQEMLRRTDDEWIGSRSQALNGLAYAQAVGGEDLDAALESITEALRLQGDHADRLLQTTLPFSPPELSLAGSQAALIDTNGYVLYRLGEDRQARAELEKSVALFEKLSAQEQAEILTAVRSYSVELTSKSNAQTLAVLLYHRSLVYDRLGMRDEANVDRQRVRNLGYEPNDQLF
ncbi:MAG: hypothetical protein O3C40_21345 [Planctomycetota bacterium]|nr:hypothetical protein [Planctomycetota bacterium]